MRSIIVGGGKLGILIAEFLIREKHDVVVIETNEENFAALEDKLDVSVIHGNGASSAILDAAGVSRADLLLAVTGSDEINMVACMLGKQAGVENAVARVSNPEYLEEKTSGASFLSGIDLIINPELQTAQEIADLIDVPEAIDVMYYADETAMVLELPISEESPVSGFSLKDLRMESPFLIVAIARKNEIIIPRGDDEIMPGDVIYLLAGTHDMLNVESFLGIERKHTENVVVLGGGRTGGHMARLFAGKDFCVRIVEKDYQKCEALAEAFPRVLVIHGDAGELDLLKQEGAGKADVFIGVTDDDKVNLLACIIAKHLGAKKTIALVREAEYVDIMAGIGIDINVSQRALTANAIHRFVKRSANLLSFTLLRDEEVGLLEFIVQPGSRTVGRRLKDIRFPKGAIVGSIQREGALIIAKGDDKLELGDKVTIFCLPKASDRVIALLR